MGIAAVYSVGFELDGESPASYVLPWLYYPLFVAYLGAAWWVWRRPRIPFALVFGFAVVFRLLAAADGPWLSSDVYRYAWDGHVQRAGINPYRHPPGDPALTALRDDAIQPRINRPAARTVYPPGAQVLFRLLPFDLDGVRLAMIAFDLLTILLLGRLLGRLDLDPARAILYAWSPLVVFEIGNSGHLEAAMLPLLVGAVLAFRADRLVRTGLLLGAATAMKLYPILAAAGLARRRPVAVLAPALGLVAAVYLVYGWSVGADVLGFLPRYVGSAEDHNIGLRAALEWLVSLGFETRTREMAFGLCVLALLAGAGLVFRRGGPIEQVMLRLTGLYLVTLPTAFHPWYALWLVPWLCVHPRASWLWLTAALPLSYLKYGDPAGLMPAWVPFLEFGPTAIMLAFESARPIR